MTRHPAIVATLVAAATACTSPATTGDTMTSDHHASSDAPRRQRIDQGINAVLGSHEVGVMSIGEEDGGPTATLSIYDRATHDEHQVTLGIGDALQLGAARYQVATIVLRSNDEPAYLILAELAEGAR